MGMLEGKTALVTGASQGIGRAISVALVEQGMRVLGTSRSPDAVVWPKGVEGISLDVGSAALVASGWDQAGLGEVRLDVVVNNAGAGAFGAFAEEAFELWEEQVGLLLLGAMKVSQLALHGWSAERPGILVTVGSLASEYPIPYMSGYNAAKAGLAAFTESLHLETDPTAVRVLELRLGDISTEFNDHIRGRAKDASQETVWKAMEKHVREGPPPEFVAAKLVDFLLSGRSGVVRVGGFFQSRIAPIFKRFISHSVKIIVNRSYYNLGRD